MDSFVAGLAGGFLRSFEGGRHIWCWDGKERQCFTPRNLRINTTQSLILKSKEGGKRNAVLGMGSSDSELHKRGGGLGLRHSFTAEYETVLPQVSWHAMTTASPGMQLEHRKPFLSSSIGHRNQGAPCCGGCGGAMAASGS